MRGIPSTAIAFALVFACSATALAQTGVTATPATEPALRFGIQAAFTIEWWAAGQLRSDSGAGHGLGWAVRQELFVGGEITPFVDLRVVREVHLRALAVIGNQTAQNEISSSDGGLGDYVFGTGFLHAGVRALIGLVPVSELAIRIGGEFGLEVLFPENDVSMYGGPMLEIAVRLLDRRNLELAVQLELQARAWDFHAPSPGGDGSGGFWTPRQGIAVAYLF